VEEGRCAVGNLALDPEFWRDRAVFVTGHTGFKGGWLATWLLAMGAKVTGYALAPDTQPSYFDLCRLGERMQSLVGDVRNEAQLRRALAQTRPEVVFHLAAQALVRRGYREPLNTFVTNVVGTANLLEALREIPSVRAVVVVTSDKCYEDRELERGYQEVDPLGGGDPYAASKACAELVAGAYRRSFFGDSNSPLALATARAGNVIGGGDWAEDRLVPDAIRALHESNTLIVRNPRAVRPWQHVLEPLSGYLMLAERLYLEGDKWGGAWNFGPDDAETITVADLADKLIQHWGAGNWKPASCNDHLREALQLKLDCTKAVQLLCWRPSLTVDQAVKMTVDWYREALAKTEPGAYQTSRDQIAQYQHISLRGANRRAV
jgi:CDP-glucose 4,6-dehydratase